MNIGINGFGRIGRAILRCIVDYGEGYFENIPQIVINDPNMTLDYMLYLLNHDTNGFVKSKDFINSTNTGTFALSKDGTYITYDNSVDIYLTQYSDISQCEWFAYSIDVLFECTGMFTDSTSLQDHISAGAKKVILCCPPKDNNIPCHVAGLNDKAIDFASENIISITSCSTQIASFLVKIIHDAYTIESGFVRLVRSYTNDQLLTDNAKSGGTWERGRAAAQNIVPTSTNAGKIIGKVIPELNGALTGLAFRTPTLLGGAVELVCVVQNPPKDVDSFKNTIENQVLNYKENILYSEEQLVSSDAIGLKKTGVILANGIQMFYYNGLLSITALYDNEIGFAMQAVKTALLINENIK